MRRFFCFFQSLALVSWLAYCALSSEAVGQYNGPSTVLPPPLPPNLDGLGSAATLPALIPTPAAIAEPSFAAPGATVPVGEPLSVPAGTVVEVLPSAATADVGGALLDTAPIVVTPTPSWYHLAYWFGPTPWDIGFELGINGTEGINEALSLRTGSHLKRETDFWKFDTTLVYNKNSANGVETQNNALLDVRIDRMLGESRWSLFFLNQELYDEFQAYDLRVSANVGIGYELIDTEHFDVLGRFGAGASREFGGPDDTTAYEALFGLEYDHELTKTQRLYAKVDYFPEWEDFSQYRAVTDVGWEIDLDRPSNMSLKFSIIDRYDSTPNGADPNEINYSVLLIWGI